MHPAYYSIEKNVQKYFYNTLTKKLAFCVKNIYIIYKKVAFTVEFDIICIEIILGYKVTFRSLVSLKMYDLPGH